MERFRFGDWLKLWFGTFATVTPRIYARSGVGLMLFKYSSDTLLVMSATGRVWTPLDYLSPFLFMRAASIGAPPTWLIFALVLWAIPFVWIGFSMSVRRAIDAGLSPWVGCLFFVPVVNYLVMILLCFLPSRGEKSRELPEKRDDYGARQEVVQSALTGAVLGLVMTALSVYGFESYAASLFLGTPFGMGFVTGYLYNRNVERTPPATMLAAELSLLIASGGLILFAMEGLFCLAMAFPPATLLATLGAAMGRRVALQSNIREVHALFLLTLLPIITGMESRQAPPPLREVRSEIEIEATPERVWPQVLGFSELPAPEEWFFRLGIAFPQRARIEGNGVGATRYCEFSTGAFVEPITHWEEPSRLAFDVVRQPPPMQEWSPYRHVNAPHLAGNLQSRRGEFRLLSLPGNRTRLEGSTWYTVDMYPQWYWHRWSDALIHAIHGRVLRHIRHLSEGASEGSVPASS